MAKAAKPVPEGYHTITPQLTLDDAAGTIEWYKKALSAEELGRSPGPDGKIMHAEIKVGDSRVMVNDVMMGKGPRELGGSPASLWLYVNDCDALFSRSGAIGREPSSIRPATRGGSRRARKISHPPKCNSAPTIFSNRWRRRAERRQASCWRGVCRVSTGPFLPATRPPPLPATRPPPAHCV